MAYIRKLNDQPEGVQRDFNNELASFLLPYFAKDSYLNNLELQLDFKKFIESEPVAYEYLLQEFLEEHVLIPEDIELAELKSALTLSRWKICSNCHQPFVAYDDKNKMILCRKEVYRRYKADGTPFISTVNQESVCFMEWRLNQRKSG